MTWFCPTFQRPERLRNLADSWEKCEPTTPLYVRVWENDPRKEDYFSQEWPETWHLYEGKAEWCGEAMNEFLERYPDETRYGFIGDDIVLRTEGGLGILDKFAGNMGVAFPNDGLQRHELCTHFSCGGRFIRALGFWAHPNFPHHYLDGVIYALADGIKMLRYCPDVRFEHQHPLVQEGVEMDATYEKANAVWESNIGKFKKWMIEERPLTHQWLVEQLRIDYEEDGLHGQVDQGS